MISDEMDESRFWLKVDVNGPVKPGMTDECWVWTGAVRTNGYGAFRLGSKAVAAHRYSFWLFNGHLPDKGMDVRHRCHNKLCQNPHHLLSGTPKQNAHDTVLERHRVLHSKYITRRYVTGGGQHRFWMGSNEADFNRIVARSKGTAVP
jgi:hypothetical protein